MAASLTGRVAPGIVERQGGLAPAGESRSDSRLTLQRESHPCTAVTGNRFADVVSIRASTAHIGRIPSPPAPGSVPPKTRQHRSNRALVFQDACGDPSPPAPEYT